MVELATGDVASASFSARPLAVARTVPARLVLFAALFALALVPVLTTPLPAMVDYVNHLARMYELAGQGTASASPYYHVEWKLYPNLAMDLVVPMLARWTGVELATRLFLLVSQILVVTGSIAIERQVKGRFDIAGFVAVLYLFNPPFAWGFLNFEAALGVALWGTAVWLAMRERTVPVRLAVHTFFVVVLFAGHMFALGLYGATLGLHEVWAARREARPAPRLVGTALLLAAPAAALIVCMAAMGGRIGGSENQWVAFAKPVWVLFMLNGDSVAVSGLGTTILVCLLYAMIRRREVGFLGSGATIAVGLAALFIVIPLRMFDTYLADMRVLVGAVLILPAFIAVRFADARAERVAALVVAGLTIVNVACVERVWQSYQPIYRDMIASFGKLQTGARVLVATAGEADDPPFSDLAAYPLYHAPTLAAHYARAFVPTLFTTRGKQPLTVAPALERLSYSCGGPVSLAALRAVAEKSGAAEPGFISNWTQDFDYVYVLAPEAKADDPMPSLLEPIERREKFAVYRVRRPAGGSEAKISAQPFSARASP